jgi:hypothetical protein
MTSPNKSSLQPVRYTAPTNKQDEKRNKEQAVLNLKRRVNYDPKESVIKRPLSKVVPKSSYSHIVTP